MLQKSRGNEVIWHCLTLGIDIKTKEHNPHNVIEARRQIVEWLYVAILTRIERLLASASLLDSRLQMIFVVGQFWVIVDVDDMMPPFFSQIYRARDEMKL